MQQWFGKYLRCLYIAYFNYGDSGLKHPFVYRINLHISIMKMVVWYVFELLLEQQT